MKFLAISLVLVCCARGAIYYIDFDSGSDSNLGTQASPWKHCRGDANVTGGSNAATVVFGPGDTINFKGGVRYIGKIDVSHSGSLAGGQITFEGRASVHGWGTGKAIIDGSVPLTMTVCTGNGTAAGEVPNANFANIYYSSALPTGSEFRVPIMENDVFLNLSSNVTSNPNPWEFSNGDYFYGLASGVTSTTITDPANLAQTDPTYWIGARVLVLLESNQGSQEITGFDPNTDTISFPNLGTPHIHSGWDNKYHYAIVNSPRLITGPGQYSIDEANQIAYVWPIADPNAIRAGAKNYAFLTAAHDYITISGFVVTGNYGGFFQGRAIATTNSTSQDGIVIQFCDIKNQSTKHPSEATGTTYIRGAGTTQCVVQDCTYSYIRGRGTAMQGSNHLVTRNTYSFVDRTVIWTQNSPAEENADGIISYNHIENCRGIHANGIAVYGGNLGPYYAKRWVVRGNTILGYINRQGPAGITAQGFWDLEISNNFIEADQGVPIDGPSAGSTYIRIFNNTVVVPQVTHGNLSAGVIRVYNLSNTATFDFRNNICHGLAISNGGSSGVVDWSKVTTHTHNRYTALSASQTAPNGWALGTGESTTTAASAFTNPVAGDYSPKMGGPLVATGDDLSEFFTTDLTGAARTTWDIGAYAGPVDAPANPRRLALPLGAF